MVKALEKIESQIDSYDYEISAVEKKLKELKKLKEMNLYKAIEFPLSHECCPDVCSSIKSIESEINAEMAKVSYSEKGIDEMITKTLPKKFAESFEMKNKARTKRLISVLEDRLSGIAKLKNILRDNNICECS